MKKKAQYLAFNTHLILCVIMLAISAVFMWLSVTDKEIIPAMISMLIGLPALFVIFISPILFIFTEQNVTIVYWFGLKETISWSNVREIYKEGSWFIKHKGPPHYVLTYPKHNKKPFFMNGEIPKTFKTKYLIEKFWGQKII